MIQNLKIGFIGFGNMAQAMADGLLRQQVVSPQQILACAKNWEKLQNSADKRGIIACASAQELTEQSDLVIIAVKPHLVAEVLASLRTLFADKLVVSVAAGITCDTLSTMLPPTARFVSSLPNTAMQASCGIMILQEENTLLPKDKELIGQLFSPISLVQWVPGSQFSVAGTLSGCGGAFACLFLEALADGALKHGLPRPLAYKLASQMLMGTGAMQLQTGLHPGVLKDAICSPGGTTIRGVSALEKTGFRGSVIAAIDAIEG